MNSTLRAYHGNPAIKEEIITRMKAHRAADKIAQRTYGETDGDGKRRACLVGCAVGGARHYLFPDVFGVPELLAHLSDAVFEGLPFEQAVELPVAFFEAIPVGADLSHVADQVAVWILSRVRPMAFIDGQAAIDAVAALLNRRIAGEEIQQSEFEAVANAANAAANAANAARAAAWAADAAANAAYAASWATDKDFWLAARDEFLRLLANAPVVADGGEVQP